MNKSMNKLTRRHFIHRLAWCSGIAAWPGLSANALAQTSFAGKLLVTVQCQGAWDVSSFCDPKLNSKGEPEINHWARAGVIGVAGNLRYAPWGRNDAFFKKHFGKMLVINGVDTQTNAHQTGETVMWSGRASLGYPSLTALYAAAKAPELALAYMALGGWGNTEGIITSTRTNSPQDLRNLIYPNQDNAGGTNTFISNSDLARIRALQQTDMQQLSSEKNLLPVDAQSRSNFERVVTASKGLEAFGALIPSPDKLQQPRGRPHMAPSTLHQQAQMALLAFKSGLAVAADLVETGFDTHANHDRDHEPLLDNLLDGVDFLWDYAEQLGLADRLVVVMGSDFSRTPYYNAGAGKDHWSIGSFIVMEKNATYTNRMIGSTDDVQNAHKLDPETLQRRDDSGGTLIYSRSVHKALRRYLGIENASTTSLFPYADAEDLRFFG